jgi:predicted CoA-binding protein
MRHLTRAKAIAARLLDRARTIAVVGADANERTRATAAYLRRAGYDVVPVAADGLANLPGAVDLVLVFRSPANAPVLLEQAAAKRVDAVWFTEAPNRALAAVARRLRLTVVVERDIARLHHHQRLSTAGQPKKLDVRKRRRGSTVVTDTASATGGWQEAGGGGRQGGGGGRAAIDEKKMLGGRRR